MNEHTKMHPTTILAVVMVTGTLIFAPHALAQCPNAFEAPGNHFLGGGDNPYNLAVSDYDRNGKLDVAVVNDSTKVQVLFGNGTGTLGAPVSYTVGIGPRSVTASDFNGDNRVDLAVANQNTDNVSILLNNAAGTAGADGAFGAATQIPAGSGPISLTSADLNGDSKIDMAVANISSGNVSVLLGNGDGTFATPVNYATADSPIYITTGDFNKDSRVDLAVSAYLGHRLWILLNNAAGTPGADGTFGVAALDTAFALPVGLATGDLDQDGDLDIVVAHDFTGSNVGIFLGNGNGTFAAEVFYAAAGRPFTAAIADLDLDGKLDLAVTSNAAPTNNISILRGNGDGTFGAATFLSANGPDTKGVAVARLRGRVERDLLAVHGGGLSVFLNHRCIDVGKEIPRPTAAFNDDVTLAERPEVAFTATPADTACNDSNSFYFALFSKKFYSVCAVDATLSWRVPGSDPTARLTTTVRTRLPAPDSVQQNIVDVPVSLGRTLPGFSFVQVLYPTNVTQPGSDKVFKATATGFNILLFARANVPDPANNPVELLMVYSRPWNDQGRLLDNQACTIGTKLTDASHNDPGYSGYAYFDKARFDGTGSDRAHDRATRIGPIIPVNTDTAAADDDMVVVWYQKNVLTGAAFPVKPVRYTCQWPASPFQIVISSELGSQLGAQPSLDPNVYKSMRVYHQPDGLLSGFNPNDEHALFAPSKTNPQVQALYALRNDLGTGSEPYALLKYVNDQGTAADTTDDEWNFTVYKVLDRNATYPTFAYTGTAGTRIQPPYPLSIMSACSKTTGTGPPFFLDHKSEPWARAAGTVTARYFYPLQESFHYPGQPVGQCVPWLDQLPGGTIGQPIDVKYTISWPPNPPVLRIGQTLTNANGALPDILHQAAASIVYDDADPQLTTATNSLAQLLDPTTPVSVDLAALPSSITTGNEAGLKTFEDLPPHLRRRLSYDPLNLKLTFKGIFDDTAAGDPVVLLNVMSPRERDRILALSGDGPFQTAVTALYHKSRNPRDLDLDKDTVVDQRLLVGFDKDSNGNAKRFEILGRPGALTAGLPTGTGFITLAFNNHTSLGSLPVSLSVIKVDCDPYHGQINVIAADNVFDEKLTLRHSGDFAGDPSTLTFEWYTHPDVTGTSPAPPTLNPDFTIASLNGWLPYQSGAGVNDVTIQGADIRTLSDNWFLVRYRGYPVCSSATKPTIFAGAPGGTTAQLAEGWIKRVVRGLNPFAARVTDFHKAATATYASMLKIAGERYEGDIALNPDPANINSVGLIAAYETVLRRGMALSVNGTPPINYEPANQALLNAAGRISDFYTLLGNEAFADAADPTIGFGTQSGEYGTLAPAIFAFQNQLGSLLDEELVLLRGRDTASAPVTSRPVYNRLFWNFTSGEGELAYAQNYGITDDNRDGTIDVSDARALIPQGHGDAWGHYLTALTTYYKLLRNPNFSWNARAESVSVAGVPIQVGFLDERKFARAAAALARTGSQLVDLNYRRNYVEDPSAQFNGYKDSDPDRAWGVVDWARRAGHSAYFDWVTANAILPDVDSDACSVLGLTPGTVIPGSAPPRVCHSGISRIDRTTVTDISEIVSHADEIQAQIDKVDLGLNPLGLAKNVVPFDIDVAQVSDTLFGQTHFEQVYNRALNAVKNSVTVFNHVNQLSLSLRRNQDTLNGFTVNVQERERDLRNRLIEIFGYPYPEDIGPAGTYPAGYQDADLYHYMHVESSELTGQKAPETKTFTGYYKSIPGIGQYIGDSSADPYAEKGQGVVKEVKYDMAVDGTYLVKPASWTGRRRATGELQHALSDLLQSRTQYELGRLDYENLIKNIEDVTRRIRVVSGQNTATIGILNKQRSTTVGLNTAIGIMKGVELGLKRGASTLERIAEYSADAVPKVVGVASDVFSAIRGAISVAGLTVATNLGIAGDVAETAGNAMALAKEEVALTSNIEIINVQQQGTINNLVDELRSLIRQEPVLRLEMFNRREAVNQSIQLYLAKLAAGERVLDELVQFRKNTAASVQQYRYEDMTFRVFRNDALQKYRAQFDFAARYTYLAAAAYDYETNLLAGANGSGRDFFTNIVRQRGLGQIIEGVPVAGSRGLADPLARMDQNFRVLKGQMGFTNPQTETNRFSMRTEWARIRGGSDEANLKWRRRLAQARVPDLWAIPEFRRYCRPFALESAGPQPGLVIGLALPLRSTITFGQNFFGRQLGGGDSAYDPSHFATKIRSVGVWFSDYNGSGLSNTPRVYLIPVGADVMRSPSGNLATREWTVVDQKIPVPFPIGASDLSDAAWTPVNNLSEEFGDIRRFSSLRAFHDSGAFSEDEISMDSRLIGRSVWNTRWLLIIPGGTLLADPNKGLRDFISKVSDIKIFFQTYAYSGN